MPSRDRTGSAPVWSVYIVPICLSAKAAKQKILLASFVSFGSLSFLVLLIAATSLLRATFFRVLRRPVLGRFILPFGVAGDGGRYFRMRSGLERNGMPSS